MAKFEIVIASGGTGDIVWSGDHYPTDGDIKEAWDVVSSDSSLWNASLWDVELGLCVDGKFHHLL